MDGAGLILKDLPASELISGPRSQDGKGEQAFPQALPLA